MSKVMKRKPSLHAVCIDPKKKNAPKKPPTKKELEQENKALKQINEALEEENKINTDKIKLLQEKVLALKNSKTIEVEQAGTQTEDEDLLFCEECEFPAETLYELGEHTGEFHTGLRIPCDFCSNIYVDKETLVEHELNEHKELSKCRGNNDKESYHNKHKFTCNFCYEIFETEKDMMVHNSNDHREHVSFCWNFQKGECEYKNNCWFIHEKKEIVIDEFKCVSCEKCFSKKADFLRHKKSHHKEKVSICKQYEAGKCVYGDKMCWFIHETESKNKEKDNTEDNSLIKRLVDMVEKLTKRVILMEDNGRTENK